MKCELIKRPMNENDIEYILSVADRFWNEYHSWRIFLRSDGIFNIHYCQLCNLLYLETEYIFKKYTMIHYYLITIDKIISSELLTCNELIIKSLLE